MASTGTTSGSTPCTQPGLIREACSSGECCTRRATSLRRRSAAGRSTASRTTRPRTPAASSPSVANGSRSWDGMIPVCGSGEARTSSCPSKFGCAEATPSGFLVPESLTFTVVTPALLAIPEDWQTSSTASRPPYETTGNFFFNLLRFPAKNVDLN